MFDVLFLFLLAVYYALAMTIDRWVTLLSLDLKLEVPQGYLEIPHMYAGMRWVFLLAAGLSALFTNIFPWYVSLALLPIASFLATWRGQTNAFSAYRSFWASAVDDAVDPESRAWQVGESVRSDSELRDRILSKGR